MSDNKIAKTDLAKNGKPDHTTYSNGGIRRSFDSDKGENVRNDHYSENGAKGTSVEPSSSPPHNMGKK